MAIEFKCSSCGKTLKVGLHLSGKSVICPACKTPCQVPSVQTKSAAPMSTSHGGTDSSEPEQQARKTRNRFRVERAVFIAITAILAGVFGGSHTDLGPFGLILMVGLIMFCFYSAAKTLMGIGGFFETVASDDQIPGFDWKRFVLDPLYFIGVFVALLLFVGAMKLLQWVFSGGK